MLFFAILILSSLLSFSQVAVNSSGNSPHSSAILDASSTTKGFLLPRLTSLQRLGISNPAKGLMVYDSTLDRLFVNTGSWSAPLWDGGYWIRSGYRLYLEDINDSVGIGYSSPTEKLSVNGNLNVGGVIKFHQGTVLSTPSFNTFVGQNQPASNTGNYNTFVGNYAGASNTTSSNSTYIGYASGMNSTGSGNTFLGYTTGGAVTTGGNNVIIGHNAGPASDANHKLYINNSSGTPLIYGDFNQKYVGICTETPGTEFAVYESNTHLNPASLVEQGGSGDAAQRFLLTGGQNFCLGVDNSDNDNFRISSGSNLGSTTNYGETTTMMRIHTENSQHGIIDFNHQSRARVFLSDGYLQAVPSWTWTMIEFDQFSYDEHGEWNYNLPTTSEFVALEEGYYQVNARTEVIYTEQTAPNAWCSIAIFKGIGGATPVMYSQGNNLQLNVVFGEEGANNNAPNVSDVVYLQAGDVIQIKVYHTATGSNLQLKTGKTQTYCSVHKVS